MNAGSVACRLTVTLWAKTDSEFFYKAAQRGPTSTKARRYYSGQPGETATRGRLEQKFVANCEKQSILFMLIIIHETIP